MTQPSPLQVTPGPRADDTAHQQGLAQAGPSVSTARTAWRREAPGAPTGVAAKVCTRHALPGT